MTISEQVEIIIQGIKPMLKAQGRDVSVLSADEQQIRVALSGFCGGCNCSQDYVDGLKDMLTEQFPNTAVELEIA